MENYAFNAPPIALSSYLTNQAGEMLQRARRSLVQVDNDPLGGGAGIVWRADGIIITNHHVVAGPQGNHSAGHIQVMLQNGEKVPAAVLALHPDVDLAILKVDVRLGQVAAVADSHDLRVGQLVFAMGHPWGQPYVVTAGVVSAILKARLPSGAEVPLIRSDALLAPGNSGGPLLNAAGGVIGINTMIIGGDQGVSIPSHLAQLFVEEKI